MDLSRDFRLQGLAFAALLALAACGETPAEDAASGPAEPAISAPPATGTITGPLTFPSDYLPDDLAVCARNVETGDQFCDADKSGATYSLAVTAGRYTVWAQTGDMPGHRAFYSNAVTCGLDIACTDHAPVIVEVAAGQTVDAVSPGDWYAAN